MNYGRSDPIVVKNGPFKDFLLRKPRTIYALAIEIKVNLLLMVFAEFSALIVE